MSIAATENVICGMCSLAVDDISGGGGVKAFRSLIRGSFRSDQRRRSTTSTPQGRFKRVLRLFGLSHKACLRATNWTISPQGGPLAEESSETAGSSLER